jgi:hypothetical protein
MIFGGKKLSNTKLCFNLTNSSCLKHFLSTKNSARYYHKCTLVVMYSARYSSQILNKLEFASIQNRCLPVFHRYNLRTKSAPHYLAHSWCEYTRLTTEMPSLTWLYCCKCTKQSPLAPSTIYNKCPRGDNCEFLRHTVWLIKPYIFSKTTTSFNTRGAVTSLPKSGLHEHLYILFSMFHSVCYAIWAILLVYGPFVSHTGFTVLAISTIKVQLLTKTMGSHWVLTLL